MFYILMLIALLVIEQIIKCFNDRNDFHFYIGISILGVLMFSLGPVFARQYDKKNSYERILINEGYLAFDIDEGLIETEKLIKLKKENK